MTQRITIKDIARELKIHHSTVSRALRNDSRVKEETRSMILEYADKIGYQTNMNALQLRGTHKNTIAVITPNIHHRIFSNFVSLIADLAREQGYVVSVFQSNESVEQEKEIIETIIQNNFAGVIASISMETKCGDHFRQLEKFRIPLVFFDRVCSTLDVPKVVVNNKDVLVNAVTLLATKGYTKIAHLTGNNTLNVFSDRQLGYDEGLRLNDLTYSRKRIITKEFTTETGREVTSELFAEEIQPDAIICDSHNLALGVILELRALGKDIPGDVALIGYGNNPSIEVIRPNITTIVQPVEELAKVSFQLLVEQLESENKIPSKKIEVSSSIIERESC